jgi:ABC-type transport system involved in cytochrome c biogenesis ATPase subunit
MDDTNKFTKALLKKIALARILCSKADIYILDRPFMDV